MSQMKSNEDLAGRIVSDFKHHHFSYPQLLNEIEYALEEKDRLLGEAQKHNERLKYLLTSSVKCSEKRRRWIEKAHHLNGCTYSDNGYSGRCDCDCKKIILTKEFEKGKIK